MLELHGKVWKDGGRSGWLIEIPFLEVMTQGKTRKDALDMIKDAVMELLIESHENLIGKNFQLSVHLDEDGNFRLTASDEKLIFALGLRRQRLRQA